MGQFAERVYTDAKKIRHLEELVDQLPANGHVVLQLVDGTSYDGVVCARPNVQVFRDHDANEGINGVVRLQRPDVPAWSCYVWLGDIHHVEHLDCTMGSES